MRCEAAQVELSRAMDDPVPPRGEVRAHAARCPRCSAFADSAWRVRTLVRLEVAPPVPNLVDAILSQVRAEEHHVGRPPVRAAARRRIDGRRVAALAAVVGLVLGFVLTAGGLVRPHATNPAALAAEIPQHLVRAATDLSAYRATFDITESDWTSAVPRRTFVAMVAFRAPEDLRVDVRDTTRYPSGAWPRNDLELVTDGRAWRASGPDPCPRAALPACPRAAPVSRTTVGRAPFDPRTPAPTDAIVPMTVLAAADRADVVGSGVVAGRPAVAVALSAQDAAPLLRYVQFLGSWRPFYPQDRVVVWLDRRTWFPLLYRVYPSRDPARRIWEAQEGLPREQASRPVFDAEVRTLSSVTPSSASFAVPHNPTAPDEGFRDLPASSIGDGSVLPTLRPAFTAGLRPWRAGSFARSDARPFDEWEVAFARGLSWLTVDRVSGWSRPMLFGVGPFAEETPLPGGGVGFYEPATSTDPRRVALHTAGGEYLVVSNLPRATLLRVAGSLPSTGLPRPDSWRIHRWAGGSVEELAVGTALTRAGFTVLMPSGLPPGYRTAAAELAETPAGPAVTIVFRRPAAELDGVGIVLSQAPGQTLPPPDGADQVEVTIRGTEGRWSPTEHMLEWVEGGVYRSISGPGFDLATLAEVAGSLRPGGSR